jgi:hypothetical protein
MLHFKARSPNAVRNFKSASGSKECNGLNCNFVNVFLLTVCMCTVLNKKKDKNYKDEFKYGTCKPSDMMLSASSILDIPYLKYATVVLRRNTQTNHRYMVPQDIKKRDGEQKDSPTNIGIISLYHNLRERR